MLIKQRKRETSLIKQNMPNSTLNTEEIYRGYYNWCFDDEYGISKLFHEWDMTFHIFTSAKQSNIKICKISVPRMNSIFNIKNIGFSLYYIFLGFWHFSFKSWTLSPNCYFHSVKITLLIFGKPFPGHHSAVKNIFVKK